MLHYVVIAAHIDIDMTCLQILVAEPHGLRHGISLRKCGVVKSTLDRKMWYVLKGYI